MFEHLLAPQNLPFAIALVMTVGLGAIEIATAFLGASLSGLVDSILPDFDLHADLHADAPHVGTEITTDGAHSVGFLGQALDWLHLGRVPALILLLTLLGSFGSLGLMLQSLAKSFTGGLAPSWLIALPAFALSLPAVRIVGGVFARLIPQEETTAISRASFIGRAAIVTTGVATLGNPAQAKLTDEHGQTHYLLVEPEADGVQLPSGMTVILTGQAGVVFKAVPNDMPELMLGPGAG
jgi:hypothetical protein